MSEGPHGHLDPADAVWARLILPPGEDLVAATAGLEPDLVLAAYRHGIFPWYEAGLPVLWWSPDPRTLLPLDGSLHVARRLSRTLRQGRFEIRLDTAFERVMRACGDARPDGRWIHEEMIRCYVTLAEQGHAHSLEVWREGQLVGGIYGVAVGGLFAAESMFHIARDMSKVALVSLVEHLRARGYGLLDVQLPTSHLARFGSLEIPREAYIKRVHEVRDADVTFK